LFFRSEENVNRWCAARGLPRRPLVSVEQLWRLAVAWYGNRLDPTARRPSLDEARAIFAAAGLEGAFWDLQSKQFGD
jgi:hypothetical protein